MGLVLLIVVLSLSLDESLETQTDVRELLSVAGLSGLLALVLGVVVGAGEYRHGTIAWTLLVAPHRLSAVSAQALACCLAGMLIGLTAFLLATAVAIPWLSAKDAPLPPVGRACRNSWRGWLPTRASRQSSARGWAGCFGTRWPAS